MERQGLGRQVEEGLQCWCASDLSSRPHHNNGVLVPPHRPTRWGYTVTRRHYGIQISNIPLLLYTTRIRVDKH